MRVLGPQPFRGAPPHLEEQATVGVGRGRETVSERMSTSLLTVSPRLPT
jgi:hypothetical protein